MGGRASSSGFSAYQRNVRKSEDTIRNEPVEHLLMLDDNGKIKFSSSDGKKGEVGLTQEMLNNAVNGIVTHNHPGGSPFSWEDVDVAVSIGLKEIRATTAHNGTYVLHRNYDPRGRVQPGTEHYMEFAKAYKAETRRIHKTVQDEIWNGKTSYQNARTRDSDLRREWLKNNSGHYGWTYKEDK